MDLSLGMLSGSIEEVEASGITADTTSVTADVTTTTADEF